MTVTASADGDVQDDIKEIRYTVAGYAGGVTNEVAVTVTVIDDDKPIVSLSLSASSILENSGVATVTATLDRKGHRGDDGHGVGGRPWPRRCPATSACRARVRSSSPAGSTTSIGTVTITPVDNATDAPDKAVTVSATASGGNGATPPSSLTLTIEDDETLPTVALALSEPDATKPDTINESGPGNASTVTATLSGASSQAVTVDGVGDGPDRGGRRPSACRTRGR